MRKGKVKGEATGGFNEVEVLPIDAVVVRGTVSWGGGLTLF